MATDEFYGQVISKSAEQVIPGNNTNLYLKVGTISGLLGGAIYDTLIPTFGATTDTWEYRKGGLTGDIIATVTITYTNGTKAVIQSVVRT